MSAFRIPSGHVFRVERARGPVWYAKYRLPDGCQVQKKLGPAWTERGRPPTGYFTKRTAEHWLRDTLDQARRGTLPSQVRTGATFADAVAEWLRYVEEDRGRKPSTVAGYRAIARSQLLPMFGELPLESITTAMIEHWLGALERSANTRRLALVLLHGVFQRAKKVWGLPANPAAGVEKPTLRRHGALEVFSPEEVMALVHAAASEQDAAIFLTAAFTGLRLGELLALSWRDVDFRGSLIRVRASYTAGALTVPKSGKVRSVPMAPDVAATMARLRQREHLTDDDLVFVGGRRRVPRRVRASPPLQGGSAVCRSEVPALPRSPAYVRDADDCKGRHPACAGMDGALGHRDHDEVLALCPAPRGRSARCWGVCVSD